MVARKKLQEAKNDLAIAEDELAAFVRQQEQQAKLEAAAAAAASASSDAEDEDEAEVRGVGGCGSIAVQIRTGIYERRVCCSRYVVAGDNHPAATYNVSRPAVLTSQS